MSTPRRTIDRLKRELKRHGITHDQVAAAANVHRTMVVHVLAGDYVSRNVVLNAERLLAEKRLAALQVTA